ncbi:MAG: tRNA (adenosine(37)-N6)-dimethylallyltransferase MiaA [Firmicutes bacterium HGW-Firmicutes-12]|nr:MAG: tRNA (adenosine(37)-N6)-dimethylallyltransferase MiaA [Firmicutes bacterium HGW-Firmicutes-12]
MRHPLVVILGPTAVGKTKLGVDIALRLNGEVISGDSMQVYKHMNIGTAKIDVSEMRGIPHHLIDIKEPDEPFSVAQFQKLAEKSIEQIAARAKLPIIVGGTGLYIQAVIDNYCFNEQEDVKGYREELIEIAKTKGNEYLHLRLAEVDPKAAKRIHVNDVKRITRALEYYHINGKSISENTFGYGSSEMKKYNTILIGLNMERQKLYERINRRVDQMFEDGFVDEVRALLLMGYSEEATAMQGLGYRQIIAYLKGEYGFDRVVELIKRDTRHFAKRQLTWFRRDTRIYWFEIDKYIEYQNLSNEIVTLVGRTIHNVVE